MPADPVFDSVRAFCLALPRATERLSHGTPCFFIEKSPQFAFYWENHHDDGRTALWLAAPPGVQEMLVQENPEVYFRPPYVGPYSWIGVRLDRDLPWDTVEGLIEEAHGTKMPKNTARS